MSAGIIRGQRPCLSLELELKVVVSCLVWVGVGNLSVSSALTQFLSHLSSISLSFLKFHVFISIFLRCILT